MNQITDIVTSSAMSIFVILVGIVAKNAVNATEQVAGTLDIHGKDKMEHAKTSLIEGLEAYNINLTNDQLNTFIEAAVKQANEQWKK